MSRFTRSKTTSKLPTERGHSFPCKQFAASASSRIPAIVSVRRTQEVFQGLKPCAKRQLSPNRKPALWTETEPEERFLLAGKIQNLRLVVSKLDGLEIPAGEIFSFWKHTGRTSRLKGLSPGANCARAALSRMSAADFARYPTRFTTPRSRRTSRLSSATRTRRWWRVRWRSREGTRPFSGTMSICVSVRPSLFESRRGLTPRILPYVFEATKLRKNS